MNSNHCVDCGEHVEECVCSEDDYVDKQRKIPVDKIMKRNDNNWDGWNSSDNEEWGRLCRDSDDVVSDAMSRHVKTGKDESFESNFESTAASCRHCGTVILNIDMSYFECPCCHRLTKAMPAVCRHVKT